MVKNVIIRILGNDLPGLHGTNQTYNNLDFTLKYESNFLDTDKLFILNRIYDKIKKQKIISLLDKFKVKYIDLSFSYDIFNIIPKINISYKDFYKLNKQQMLSILYYYNLYLVNINSCRNYAIKYGKDNNYENIFVLDSNNYLLKSDFERISRDIENNKNIDYFILPQKRLKDGNMFNNSLLVYGIEKKLNLLENQEPQIVFKNTARYGFNKLIPYGYSEKAELINSLNVRGKWNNWCDHNDLGIYKRNIVSTSLISGNIIRLHPDNINNDIKNNSKLRSIGLYKLIQEIYSNTEYNTILKYIPNINNNYFIKSYLIDIILKN
jgi:hypothetical protein